MEICLTNNIFIWNLFNLSVFKRSWNFSFNTSHDNLVIIQLVIRDDFFQLFNWFLLFSSWTKISENCRKWSEQVNNGPFEKECWWFHLFFIDFQLFYFIIRILPGVSNWYVNFRMYATPLVILQKPPLHIRRCINVVLFILAIAQNLH
jgi:hypothetical protein